MAQLSQHMWKCLGNRLLPLSQCHLKWHENFCSSSFFHRGHCQAKSLSSLKSLILTENQYLKYHNLHRRDGCRTLVSDNSIEAVNLSFDSVIIPDLDVEERLTNICSLERNARLRKLNLDAKRLLSDYRQLVELEKEKLILEQQRRENADLMKHVIKSEGEQQELEKIELKRRGKLIRDKLKNFQDEKYRSLCKKVISEILMLPVDLHPTTPEEDKVVADFGCRREFSFKPLNHLELWQKMKLIDFRESIGGSYYLLNDAACLERHLLDKITGNHLRSSGLQRFICPDMVKTFVANSCGFNGSEFFEMANKETEQDHLESPGSTNDLRKFGDHNLVLSGVSCLGFAAYLSAVNIDSHSLPLKYYSIGPNYTPVFNKELGLYTSSQANSAALFGVDSSSAVGVFDEFLSITLLLYKNLDIPFRVVQVGASNLRLMESKRTDLYIWSAGFNRYIKTGELRLCNDYISRRLSISHGDDLHQYDTSNSSKNFVHTVDGVIIKIPSVVAALVEQSQNKDGTCSLPKLA